MNARPILSGACAAALAVGMVFSPLAAWARPPRAERAANRIAERRYARLSIAEARAVQAEARVAEIAPLVPVPPPPRPATVRRMARAGVPLGGPTPPAVVAAPAPPSPRSIVSGPPARPTAPVTAAAPARPAAPAGAADAGAWTLDPDEAVTPATAEVAPDGTRSVLAAGGEPAGRAAAQQPSPAANEPSPSGAPVTQPAIELLPTPPAN